MKMCFYNIFKLALFLMMPFLLAGCFADVFLEPGPTNSINPFSWKKVKIGMSKDQVRDLLGDAPSQHEISIGDIDKPQTKSMIEYWEYNYHSPPFGDPHPRAYVIYFNEKGLVTKLREPINTD